MSDFISSQLEEALQRQAGAKGGLHAAEGEEGEGEGEGGQRRQGA